MTAVGSLTSMARVDVRAYGSKRPFALHPILNTSYHHPESLPLPPFFDTPLLPAALRCCLLHCCLPRFCLLRTHGTAGRILYTCSLSRLAGAAVQSSLWPIALLKFHDWSCMMD